MGTIVITGGTRGLGLRAIHHVAEVSDHDVVLTGRSKEELASVADDLRARTRGRVKTVSIDTSSLTSVTEACAAIRGMVVNGDVGRIAALMLNAGVQAGSRAAFTVDGFETTFATNCLGPFLMVNLLLDLIEEGGRVVWTVSGTHDPKTIDGKLVGAAVTPDAEALASTGRQGKPLPGGVRYTTSKLCDILYSYELQRRLRSAGSTIISIAYDPGYVPETGLTRDRSATEQWISRTAVFKWLFGALGGTVGSLAFSGRGLGRMAVDPAFASSDGTFIQSSSGKLIKARSSELSYDARLAATLWRDSERLTGLDEERSGRR